MNFYAARKDLWGTLLTIDSYETHYLPSHMYVEQHVSSLNTAAIVL
jgi:hypothetical protein